MSDIITKVKTSTMDFLKYHMKSGSLFVFALGMCIMNGKQVVAWNIAIFWFGFYVVLITTMVAGLMSIMLTYSFSEMVSIVPFSGGCYGYVRCTLGPVAGYITGVMEMSKYMLYTTMMVYLLGDCFTQAYDIHEDWVPVVWLAFFAFSVSIQVFGNRFIWWTWGLIAVAAISFQLMFIIGGMKDGKEINLSSHYNRWQKNYVANFFGFEIFTTYTYETLYDRVVRAIPFANFLFCGIDAVRTCANDQSNKTVPYAMVFVDYWTYVIVLATIIAARAYFEFTFESLLTPYPYDAGMLIAYPGVHPQLVTLMSVPGAFGTALGFNFAAGRQVRSMACSGLLPSWLATTVKDDENEKSTMTGKGDETMVLKETKPIVAIIFCSTVSFIILVASYYEVNQFIIKIIRMADLQTCIEAFGTSAAYIVFATRFDGMERTYRSPVGIFGAVVVICYFAFTFATMLQHHYHDQRGLCLTLFFYFIAAMIYYVLVVNKRQFYSKEEQDKFMKAYIVNANKRRRLAKGTAAKQGTTSMSSDGGRQGSSGKLVSSVKTAFSQLSAVFGGNGSAGATIVQQSRVSPSPSKPFQLPTEDPDAAVTAGDKGVNTAPALNGRVNPADEMDVVDTRPAETVGL